jgi:uncharacterized protein YjdB
MKKMLLLSLFSFIMITTSFAQTDSILLATYEPGGPIKRTFSWTGSDTSTVANPVSDAVNNSATVLKFVKSSQWSSAPGLNNLGGSNSPVSFYQYPIVMFSLMSDSALSKDVQVEATDIYGYKTVVTATSQSPSSKNVWKTMTVDFSSALTSTPLSLVKEIVIFIDRGNSSPLNSRYYVDNVRLKGPHAAITTSTILTFYSEVFSNNPWWMPADPEGGSSSDKTFLALKNGPWGNNLTGGAEHYNMNDSIKAVLFWTGYNAVGAQLYPASVRASHSVININNLRASGKSNLAFYYDLWWKDAPTAFTDAPQVEYQMDGGSWTVLSTSSTLPSAVNTWAKGVEFPLTGASGSLINIRITNNTTGRCNIANLALKGTSLFADSIKINAAGNAKSVSSTGSLQFSSTTYPVDVKDVYWYVVPEKGSISSSGLYTPNGATKGDVKIKGMSTCLPVLTGEYNLHISTFVQSITVTPKNDTIKTLGGTIQMSAAVLPADADSANVTWSVTNLTGEASISSTGLLTAAGTKDGKVIVKATARDASNVVGVDTITIINNQVYASSIAVKTKNDATTITTNGGELFIYADILPANTGVKAVNWSLKKVTGDGSLIMHHDSTFVKAIKNGTVYVKGITTDGTNIADSVLLTFSGQQSVTSVTITSTSDSIKTDKGTLQLTAKALPSDAADTTVLWKIISPSDVPDTATINGTTGLVSAFRNGSVSVVAYSLTDPDVSDTIVVKIIHQIVAVKGITVAGGTAITTNGTPLQMSVTVSPADATNKDVIWSITNHKGDATISNTGLLSPYGNDTVTVRATAADGSNVYGEAVVVISGQRVMGITVKGAGNATAITKNGISLQMIATVSPRNVNDTVTWSVVNHKGEATITPKGELKPYGNDTVTVRATAKDGSNVYGEAVIAISGQIIAVRSLTVAGAGNATTITTKGGTLQMSAILNPTYATPKTITWSVTNGTGQATIDSTGLLKALQNGTVTVKANATNQFGPSAPGELVITISGQPVAVTGITVAGAGNAKTITAKGGTLQMNATVTPTDATNKDVTWSVTNGTGQATISNTGLLTAAKDGTVAVRATAADGSNKYDEVTITISGQTTGISSVLDQKLLVYPNPVVGIITVDNAADVKQYAIMTINGKVLFSGRNSADKLEVNVSSLTSGMYILKVYSNEITREFKFMKK